MRKSRFTEAKIIGLIKEQEAGLPTSELCRKHGLSPATFYKLEAKYGGMDLSGAKRLKQLEDENAKLKRQPKQNGCIESFNGSLRDDCLNEEILDSLADARRKLALWRDDYNNVRPHSPLGNKTPAEARRALEQSRSVAPGALAQPETNHYQPKGPPS